jgi:hypothetical protein
MAAMKPRTGDGPLEVTKEGRGIVMRVPLEGGGRLVVELSADEAAKLGDALQAAVGWGRGDVVKQATVRMNLLLSLDGGEHAARDGEQQRD